MEAGMRRGLGNLVRITAAAAAAGALVAVPAAQTPRANAPAHAKAVKRLLIRNAMIIPGTGVPAYGPSDILVEDGLIARIGSAAEQRWPDADATIDVAGKYVMPGIVNTHMHGHE